MCDFEQIYSWSTIFFIDPVYHQYHNNNKNNDISLQWNLLDSLNSENLSGATRAILWTYLNVRLYLNVKQKGC